MNPSPVVALNRAVARARARGPEPGLAEMQLLLGCRQLGTYVPLHVARGELLHELGRQEEAAGAYRRALELSSSEPLRRHLARRLEEVAASR